MPQNDDSTKDKKPIMNPFVVEVEPSPSEEKPRKEEKQPGEKEKPSVIQTPAAKPKDVVKPSSFESNSTTAGRPHELKTPPVKNAPSVQKKPPQLPDKLKLEARQAKPQWGMFAAGAIVTLLLAGAGVRVWWVQNSRMILPTPTPAMTTQPTIAATPAPSPTPLPLERGAITVNVLNASGEKGKANQVANQIKDLGYKKGTVGNTSIQTGTTISFTSDIASLSAQIKDDLSTVLPGAAIDTKVVKGKNTVEVRLGK